jgi:hypothetical protein
MPRIDFQQLLDQAIEAPKLCRINSHRSGLQLLLLHEGKEFLVALILHLLQWNEPKRG